MPPLLYSEITTDLHFLPAVTYITHRVIYYPLVYLLIYSFNLTPVQRSRVNTNDQKQTRSVNCHILASPDANLKTDNWPRELIMQVIPHKFLVSLHISQFITEIEMVIVMIDVDVSGDDDGGDNA